MPVTVTLPGGYVDPRGQVHRDVELVPLSGRDEELLGESDSSNPSRFMTVLLSCCVRRLGTIAPVPRDVVRELLIADRLYLALKLRETISGGRVQATVRCPRLECGQKADIEFSLDGIPVRESVDKGPHFTRQLSPEASGAGADEPCEVTFRLPTGADQEAMPHTADARDGDALELLLVRCVLRVGSRQAPESDLFQHVSPLGREEITRHMEKVAPAVDLTLGACCPECRGEFEVPFDIQRLLLAECQASRERLYRDVHTLAYHYHWSEHEIMTLPRVKRRTYLAMLSSELRSHGHAV